MWSASRVGAHLNALGAVNYLIRKFCVNSETQPRLAEKSHAGKGVGMVSLGVVMMVTAIAVFLALLPRGGEPRLQSDNAQAFGLMALMLVFILGAVFALGLN